MTTIDERLMNAHERQYGKGDLPLIVRAIDPWTKEPTGADTGTWQVWDPSSSTWTRWRLEENELVMFDESGQDVWSGTI